MKGCLVRVLVETSRSTSLSTFSAHVVQCTCWIVSWTTVVAARNPVHVLNHSYQPQMKFVDIVRDGVVALA